MGVFVDSCFVCGFDFIKNRKNATCCSPECSKRKEVLREFERRKEKRLADPMWLENERSLNAKRRESNKESESDRVKRWRSENPIKRALLRTKYHKNMPQEKKRAKKLRYYEAHPEARVREQLAKELGFRPTPDLVEEATALRLLKRGIRKAG